MDELASGEALPGEFVRAAEFRRALRRFLERTKVAAAANGLTPERYDLLLAVRASPDGETSIGELGAALQIARSSATELVQRAEEAGLVYRVTSAADGRVTHIRLTQDGDERLTGAFVALRADREAAAEAFRNLDRRFRAIARGYATASSSRGSARS